MHISSAYFLASEILLQHIIASSPVGNDEYPFVKILNCVDTLMVVSRRKLSPLKSDGNNGVLSTVFIDTIK
jgi:hypothetical protein